MCFFTLFDAAGRSPLRSPGTVLVSVVGTVNQGNVAAAEIGYVNLIGDRIRGNCDWILRVRVLQWLRSFCHQ